MTKSVFVGVDGCPGGWFSVGLDSDGSLGEGKVFCKFADLLAHHADAKLILVDIPIGLPWGKDERKCDKAARKKLGRPRQSSVFRTPTRQAVEEVVKSNSYEAASHVQCEVTKKGLSKQTFNIMCKIAQVDKVLDGRDAGAKPEVREVHPEVCFWALKGGKPMSTNKKKRNRENENAPSGEEERISTLERVCLPEARIIYWRLVTEAKASGERVAKDDILDALAAAVTGWLAAVGKGKLATLPAKPQYDALGLPMEMVYCVPYAQSNPG